MVAMTVVRLQSKRWGPCHPLTLDHVGTLFSSSTERLRGVREQHRPYVETGCQVVSLIVWGVSSRLSFHMLDSFSRALPSPRPWKGSNHAPPRRAPPQYALRYGSAIVLGQAPSCLVWWCGAANLRDGMKSDKLAHSRCAPCCLTARGHDV